MGCCWSTHHFLDDRCIVWSHVNNLFQWSSRDRPQLFYTRSQATGHALGVVLLSFDGRWWGWNCARNSRVDYLSRPEGCDLKAEGLEPYHDSARVVDASYFETIGTLTLHQFCTRNRLTVLPGFQIDFRAPLKWCGRWAGLLLRWTTLINLVPERWCINSLKLSYRLRTS